MDRDTLRLGLAIAGVLLVLGIVIWDWICRYREKKSSEYVDDLSIDTESEFSEVSLNAKDDQILQSDYELPSIRANLDDIDHEENPEIDVPLAESAELSLSTESSAELEADLIQLFVVARDGMCLPGTGLFAALNSAGMELGQMNIYHRNLPGETLPIFSAVNMVEPGTFPREGWGTFTTPGIALFLQCNQVANPLEAFEEMIRISYVLAARLGAEVQDENRKPLSVEKTELLRNRLNSDSNQ